MFRLTEPSSGHIQNIELVYSVSAHYGIPYCLQNYIDFKGHILLCQPMYLKWIYKTPVYIFILNTSANRIKHDV
jgi:hypothetical protein